MANDRHRQRVLGGVALAVTAASLALYTWASRDTSAPDDSHLVLPPRAAPRPQDNGFLKLESLGDDVEQLAVAGSGRLRIPATYDDRSRAAADEILRLDLVQRLPERLEEILAAPSFQPTAEPGSQEAANGSRGRLDIMRLLRLRMQRQLVRDEREEAWRTAELGLRFGQFLQERTQTFHELTLAQASQSSFLRAVLSAIDANQWSANELRAVVALPELAGLPERLLQGVRSEYASFGRAAEQASVAVGWPRRHLLYQANRTKRAWLEATAEPIAALHAGDLPAAHQALTSAQTVAVRDGARVRNALGHRLVATSVAGIATPIAQAVDSTAQLRLIKLRAAMALHRLQHGRWPARLAELVRPYFAAMPLDPWSRPVHEFRYSVGERRIYSVGPNERDDSGRFTDDFSHRSGSDDYGLRLPE